MTESTFAVFHPDSADLLSILLKPLVLSWCIIGGSCGPMTFFQKWFPDILPIPSLPPDTHICSAAVWT